MEYMYTKFKYTADFVSKMNVVNFLILIKLRRSQQIVQIYL